VKISLLKIFSLLRHIPMSAPFGRFRILLPTPRRKVHN
jgi:hypothetical protein